MLLSKCFDREQKFFFFVEIFFWGGEIFLQSLFQQKLIIKVNRILLEYFKINNNKKW